MKRRILVSLNLVIIASGCIGSQSASEGFLTEYDSNVLQLQSQGQGIKFILNKNTQNYTIQTSSPVKAEEMFSDVDNRTRKLRDVCSTLKDMAYSGVNRAEGQQKFNILNQDGEVLESKKSINTTKLAATLERYELSKVEYTVLNESGDIEAECIMQSKQDDGIEIKFYGD
ncbi:MAG: hypothetical protein BRC29_00475 [Nanohaloarchaea archaeon SW_7_43_1]|nr:MAG: hypothetical protein BRC29_00475 [Nanohaloarchaea archaeon SW_7_43_1]